MRPFYYSTYLVRPIPGGTVNRTYGTHKNQYVYLFLLIIFGPIYYGPDVLFAVDVDLFSCLSWHYSTPHFASPSPSHLFHAAKLALISPVDAPRMNTP